MTIIKCVKAVCETDSKEGLIQVFYRKDGRIVSARIRHYLGTESGKPKFSYCSQSVDYAKAQLSEDVQKHLIDRVASKAIAIGENLKPDQGGHVSGLVESSSNHGKQANIECGCSLAWFGFLLAMWLLSTLAMLPLLVSSRTFSPFSFFREICCLFRNSLAGYEISE